MTDNSTFLKFGHYVTLCAFSQNSETDSMQTGLLSARGYLKKIIF